MEEVEWRETLLQQRHWFARTKIRETETRHRDATHVGLMAQELELRRGVVPEIGARI